MPLLDTVSTGFSPELVHALNDSVTSNVRTGTQARVSFAPGEKIDVYVDAVDGNDNNDGSFTYPLQSIDQVYRAVASAAVANTEIVVHLAGPKTGGTPVDYPVYQLIFSGHAFRGPEMLLAPVSTATAALDATPATAQTNRTRLNFTTAAPAWTSNELRGYFVRIKRDGALQFPELPIAGNDADRIYVNTASLAADVLSTDTVEIVRPGANIVGINQSYGFPLLLLAGQHGLGSLSSCALERLGIGDFVSTSVDTAIEIDRCKLDCPYVAIPIGRFSFVNTVCSGSMIVDGWVDNSQAVSRQNYASGKFVDLLVYGGKLQIGEDAISGYFKSNYDVSVYDSSQDGILCYGPASYFVANQPGSTIQGTGNSGVGISAKRGGRVSVLSDASKVTITGSGGDLSVGNGAPVSYGTGVGEFREALGWNGNLTRVLAGTATAPTGDTSQIECIF